ncbi:hypothetical protein [Rhodovibrio salinarum]|uniref:Uncharacterized protein n=1 Tax=Rhodovibrio salinarum TaxID=1087 RepID=A0A934QKK3_9PROT|nr:hypothetical protein [Rhodovibrio salinarum]MBK1698569.1 hypothetical protein [Rhodovibrio salinarum]
MSRRPAAKSAARQASAHPGGRRLWRSLSLIVLLLPAAAVLLPTTLVLVVCMMPTLAAWLVDRQPGRALATSVCLLNLAGSLPAVLEVWNRGHDVASAQWVMSDPVTWLAAYGAAAVGWLLFALLPPVLRAYHARTTARRIRQLQKKQEALEKDWGPEVAADVKAAGLDEHDAAPATAG